jgi:hypothetical protein
LRVLLRHESHADCAAPRRGQYFISSVSYSLTVKAECRSAVSRTMRSRPLPGAGPGDELRQRLIDAEAGDP